MNPDIQSLVSSLSPATSVLVVLPQNPDLDKTAAALGLSLALSKSGKKSSVVAPTPMTAGLSRLVGVDQITDQLNNKNLVISFAVPEEAIEKVSYNYENNKLNFIVEPAAGYTAPSKNQVNFAYTGLDADLVIFLGVERDSDLGKLQNSGELMSHPNQHHLTAFPPSSHSLVASQVVESASLSLDEDIATNLMMGLDWSTQNLSQNITPEVLEAAAKLLRAGATRQPAVSREPREQSQFQPERRRDDRDRRFRDQRRDRPYQPRPQAAPAQPPKPQTPPSPQPEPAREPVGGFQVQSTPVQSHVAAAPQPQQPQPQPSPEDTDQESPAPQPDWFEPKIYKGSTLI